jgi:predicted nucleotidyltransferase
MTLRDPDAVVRELLPLVRAFCAGEPCGVALGGSHAKGTADAHSDVDVYLFAESFLPAARRGELVAARLGDAAQPVSWGADDPFVEGGTDFWLDGVRVECWLRRASTMEATIADCLAGRIRREYAVWTAMGYFNYVALADVRSMRIVHDPAGMLARWKAQVAVYPEPLRDAIIRRFMAEAAFWPDNPHYLSAIERGDVIYTSAILQQVLHASIQAVFALNREYFPGEKKLAEALETLPVLPQRFAAVAEGLLFPSSRLGVEEMREQRRALASRVGELRCLLTDCRD